MVLKKSVQLLISEANKEITSVTADEAIEKVNKGAVLLDVREPNETKSGIAKNAICIPRGMLEFIVDPESPLYDARIREESEIIVYCASGGRGALAVKTLTHMGYLNVTNLLGGYASWKESGGDVS